jgi:hypothetical protein
VIERRLRVWVALGGSAAPRGAKGLAKRVCGEYTEALFERRLYGASRRRGCLLACTMVREWLR